MHLVLSQEIGEGICNKQLPLEIHNFFIRKISNWDIRKICRLVVKGKVRQVARHPGRSSGELVSLHVDFLGGKTS